MAVRLFSEELMALSGTVTRAAPLFVFLCLLLALTGCTSTSSTTATSEQTEQVAVVLAASEVLVGKSRFPFGLFTVEGQPINGANVRALFYKLRQDGTEELRTEARAAFREVRGVTPHHHEDEQVHGHIEARGVYVVDTVDLDEPGLWRAKLEISGPESPAPLRGSLDFPVKERSATLRVGDPVPPSRNPTAYDVDDITKITTHSPPVPGLYQLTVAEALRQPKPFVALFSTPAFCMSRMCGPVTDVVAQVYEEYKDRANFIHIEPWDLETARNTGRLQMSDVAREWRLPSEPWVFVITGGRVSSRFEGLVTGEELSAALNAIIK